jgi:DHA2 family multidrug resistance protein
MLITLITTYEFTNLTLATSYTFIVVLYMVRMVGMGLLMMPIQTAGMNELPREKNAHGTALSNTTRQIAGSIGISLITTIFTNRTTFHMEIMRNSTNTMDPQFQQSFMDQAIQMSQQLGISIEQAQSTIASSLYGQISLQSSMVGIQDAFYWTTGITVLALILSFFLTDVRKKEKTKQPNIRELEKPKQETKKLEPLTTS